ncbi:MAG TPA: ABC transporter ATP-binding protein [Casimicrobiaceae bacterium]|nr:ABC transporter ATP-binding protein [Casimicrobiaceae bacterium]
MPSAREVGEGARELAIDVRGLTKRYGGRAVVDHLAIRVGRGLIFGFLGPNGSGKTTTIRMLCGLLTPDEGEGTCLGYDLRRDAAAIKREVGYMTQRFSLYEDLSIEENLDFVARMYEVRDRRQAIGATLARLGLSRRRAQLAGTLSGGWKQRLALAACMLHDPQLLLLDEPTAGVDPKARRDFWEEIHALAADGITVLVSTHYMDEAERCHRLAYINLGKLLVEGTPEDVIAHSRLTTWLVSLRAGGDERALAELARELREAPGVDTVIPFGLALRVSGHDARALDAALTPIATRAPFAVERAATSLEDVFVNLMQQAPNEHPPTLAPLAAPRGAGQSLGTARRD